MNTNKRIRRGWRTAGVIAAAAAAIGALAPGAHAQARRPKDEPARVEDQAFEASVRAKLAELEGQFAGGTRPSELSPLVEQLFDLTIAYASESADRSLMRDVNALRRKVSHLAVLKGDEVGATRELIARNPRLAHAAAMTIDPEIDQPGNAYAVLRLLAEKFPDRVLDKPEKPAKPGARRADEKDDLTNLVVAMAIVFDGAAGDTPAPIRRERVEALFDYFSSSAGKLTFGPQSPPELLAYVVSVDARVTIEDLHWALRSYQNHRTVGKLYHGITYDTNAFKRGTPKKVEQAPGGVTLQNIRKYGGVCAEQALFAANVGKAIGVPAVVVSGRGADVGHAWVGYLKPVGNNRHEWDFDEGRYKEYQDLRGDVTDPRSGKRVSDGYVGLTAGLMVNRDAREQATTLLDAADRLLRVESTKLSYPPGLLSGMSPSKATARPSGLATRLALIEAALRLVPAERRGWEMVAALAQSGRLSADELKTWSERLLDLCADDYPDFALAALTPMIRSVKDTAEQDRLWEWTANRFNKRKDLAAAATLMRGDLYQQAGDAEKAWGFYTQVIERYPNDGQIVLEALARAEHFLKRQNKSDAVLDLYADAWSRIHKPTGAAAQFTAASNYVVVGKAYAAVLQSAGRGIDAKKIQDAVQQVLDK